MKKNLVFKLGLFCAALVLVATCFVTNAWAKYTRSVTASDVAQVAHFEVSLSDQKDTDFETVTFDIFTTNFTNIQQDSNTNTIGGVKLIAPGSYGSFAIKYNSDSQVAVHFDFEILTEDSGNIPLKWTLDGATYNTLNELFAAVNGATAYTDYAPNSSSARTLTIGWSWAYEDGRDPQDTVLGEAGTAKYQVSFKITATQVKPVAA